jgi:hypothetical protein
MPAYVNSPFQVPKLALNGVPCYLFGTLDYKVGDTRLFLISSSLTTNVATLIVQWMSGPLPLVGQYVSVISSTNGAGSFNVTRSVLTAVAINAITGIGTLTFALTHADIGSATDYGTVVVENAEVGDTLTNNSFSQACVYQIPDGDSQFSLPLAVTFGGTIPSAVVVTLQQALRNPTATVTTEFTNTTTNVTVAASAYTSGPVVNATLQRGYLYRLAVTGLTGGSTIVGKLG